MNEPVDLFSAASDGFFALLDAAIDAELAEVTTNPPPIAAGDTSERQWVVIGDIDSENSGGKGEQAETLTVQIVTIYRGNQRSKLHALMHRVRVALEDRSPAIAGVAFGSIDFIGAAAGRAGADGITHAGISEFSIFGEPA